MARAQKALVRKSQRLLDKYEKRERAILQQLGHLDSMRLTGQLNLSAGIYNTWKQKLKMPLSTPPSRMVGEYLPLMDSIKGSFSFLQGKEMGIKGIDRMELQDARTAMDQLQARFQQVDELKSFIRDRRNQMASIIGQYSELSGSLTRQLTSLNK
ncbi:MAG TPA: hypothetical protein VG870_05500 [Chitinophagaceae bacterium]|nr:hypothetical protein [Chitinophagaceae bacterium]